MKRKLYKCKQDGCEIMQPILSKGLCKYHRYLQKGNPLFNYKTKLKKKNVVRQNKKEVLSYFFNYHLEKIKNKSVCQNCGVKIKGNICNIAHILPKRLHKEVMGNIHNCIYLCASINSGDEIGCHDRFDRIQGNSQVYLMNCWPLVIENYLKFRENVLYFSKYREVLEEWLNENK